MPPTQIAARFLLLIALLSSFPAALSMPPRVLAQTTISDSRKTQADQLRKQGNQLFAVSRFNEALNVYQQALKLYQQIEDRRGEGASLSGIGAVYLSLGQYPKALVSYQQALKVQQTMRDRRGESLTLIGMGTLYWSLGQYSKALGSYQQALKIQQTVQDRRGEGGALTGIGTLYWQLGQYPKALDFLQQALQIQRTVQDRPSEGTTLSSIGLVYLSLGQDSKALDFLQQALQVQRTMQDRRGEGATLSNIAAVYQGLGQDSKALDFRQQALQIHRTVRDRLSEGATLSGIGRGYSNIGQYPKALDFYQQALQIQRTVRDRSGEGKTLSIMGALLIKLKQYRAAEQSLYQAIAAYEQLRPGLQDPDKISLNETQRNPYDWLQIALVAQNKTTAALEVAERGRTRALVELLATRLAGNPNEVQTIQRLSQPPTIAQIQRVAKQQNATLVEYSVLGKELYIWLVRPTGQIQFRKTPYQFSRVELQELVSVTRGELQRGARRSSTPLPQTNNDRLNRFGSYQLRKLHQLLIEPIADLLPKNPNDRVIFIPQNELFLVPFPALMDAKGNYLIEQHTLLSAPSIQVLSLTQQNQQRLNSRRDRTALVVGNPTLPKLSEVNLSPLPAAEQEARTIAQLFRTTPMIGSAATEAAVVKQMPQARFIHLATHGLLTRNNGEAPGAIVLAPNRPNQVDDGLLTPTEILGMNLTAELVVLSACDTAQGDVTSDGIVGLSRSLVAAGVPSVVVSLWSISDVSTSVLMSEFYRNLQNTQRNDRARALRQAMLTTMKHPDFASPYYWAAFTLIGEAD
ncbi:CHAT domain-containing protein [Leptolyngbya sp. AN03gr2]|uniref:CHAT domain-containing protein n=1 Tax=unclassified Leptolyngbya TaxID=2650499 RepID=UPI003D30FA2D